MVTILLHTLCGLFACFTAAIRRKKSEKCNTANIAIVVVSVLAVAITGALAIFSNIEFFETYAFDIYAIFFLVLAFVDITDIAFGTFSKPGTARKAPKKYPVWVWIASFVGAWAITLGVIFVTIMLASNY